jgi:phage-related minor tail protein
VLGGGIVAGGVISNLMYAVGFKMNTRGVGDADKKIGNLTKSVVGLGLAAAAVAAGIGVAAVSAASEFEKAMSDVQGATGSASEQMEETREIAKNLYSQNLGEDWKDLGSTISAVQQVTGQTGAALEETTRNAILLRDQFGFEINESVKSTDTMMRQFGITSTDSMNLLAQGAQQGLNKSDELIDSANEYANQFKSLGFSAEEMFDVFAAGSAEGVFQLDKVGDAVKEFNIRSKDGSKASIEAFEMLGLNAEAMMQTFARGGPEAKQGFNQILQMISDVADPVLKNQIGVALLGTQFEDLEASVVAGMGSAMSQFDSAATSMEELNKIKFDKPGEAFAMFRRQLEVGILIPIGEKVLPYLTQFGQWLSEHKPQIAAVGATIGNVLGKGLDAAAIAVRFLYDKAVELTPAIIAFKDQAIGAFQSVTQAIEDNKTTILVVAGIITGIFLPALIKSGVQAVIAGAKMTTSFVMGLIHAGAAATHTAAVLTGRLIVAIAKYAAQGWKTLASITATTVAWTASKIAMGISTVATWAMTAATWALSAAFWANPITWIVVGIIAVIAASILIFKNWGTIGPWLSQKWAAFKTAVVSIFNSIVNFFKQWGPKILLLLGGPVTMAVALVIKYWDQIKMFTIGVFSAIGTIIKTAWDNMVSTISGALNRTWTTITNIWSTVMGFFKGIDLKEIGMNIIQGLIDGVLNMKDAVVNKVKDVADSITSGIKDALGIHSPSRVMMELGFFTGEGLARGIEGTQERVGNTSTGLGEEVVNRQSKVMPAAAPAQAPARYAVPVSQSQPMVFNIEVKVNGGDGGAAAQNANVIAAEVKRQVQEILDSAGRILNVQVATNG